VFHPAEAALAGTLIAVAILAVYEMWTGAVSPL
jgi:arginine:ornithine antiporter/lysine permease